MSTDRHIELDIELDRKLQVITQKLNQLHKQYGPAGVQELCEGIPFLQLVEDHGLTKDQVRDQLSRRLTTITDRREKNKETLRRR